MGNYLSVFLAPRVLGWLAVVVLLSAAITCLLRKRLQWPRSPARAGVRDAALDGAWGGRFSTATDAKPLRLPPGRSPGVVTDGVAWGGRSGEATDATEPLRPRHGRPVLFFLFLVSLGLVIAVTLLREPWTGACPECLAEWHWERVLTGRVGTEVWLNVVLFVPLTLFATLLWRAPWRTAGAALLLSLAVEIAQPLVGAGANDAMDLVANASGGLIGAGAGAVLVLVGDALRRRPVGLRRIARVGLSLAAGVAVLFGAPAWSASVQQAAAVERLEEMFATTTLTDFQDNWDDGWDATLNDLQREWGGPARTTMIVRVTDEIARVRFSWNIYFAVRCVFAEWMPDGFAAVPRSGSVCTARLDEVP